jgi:hypothetical protein
MSNSPGLRGGEIGSAIPESFNSSPNSGLPRQRTNKLADVDLVSPSNSIDSSLNRKVAKPFVAIFGSEVTKPIAVTTRGPLGQIGGQSQASCVARSEIVDQEKSAAHKQIGERDVRFPKKNECDQHEAEGPEQPLEFRHRNEIGNDNSKRRHERESNERLPREMDCSHGGSLVNQRDLRRTRFLSRAQGEG